jgi:hypothetical protein
LILRAATTLAQVSSLDCSPRLQSLGFALATPAFAQHASRVAQPPAVEVAVEVVVGVLVGVLVDVTVEVAVEVGVEVAVPVPVGQSPCAWRAESIVAQVVSFWPARAAAHCWAPAPRAAQHAWAAAQLPPVEVAVEVDVAVGVVVEVAVAVAVEVAVEVVVGVLVGVLVDVTVEVAVEVGVEVAVPVPVGQSPCAWRAESIVAQVVSFWPTRAAAHCWAPAPRVAQHAWAAAQLPPVEVAVEVDVAVGVAVEVAVAVPPGHTGCTHFPVGAVLLCEQLDKAIKAVRQGDPTARFCKAQVDSHVDAVLSQGHCISQVMKATQGLPVKSPLA